MTKHEMQHVTDDGEFVAGLPAAYGEATQSLAVSLARAEVDQQIATARAMPRSVKRAVDNILSLATLDERSAEECVYALPRGGKPIKGPSIRLAEIIAGQWGNCRVGARVVHVDRLEKYVEAEGIFHDLETNVATTSRVRRRISDKHGRLLNDDMIVVTGNAACAIAKRNAILGAVPKAVWRRSYDAVESVVAGDVKTLAERRDNAMKAFATFGVTPEQIFEALGIAGMEEITLEHMPTLMGMHSALKSGEATVEEMFPKKPAPGKAPAKSLQEFGSPATDTGKTEAPENEKPKNTTSKNAGPAASEAGPAHTSSAEGGTGDISNEEAEALAEIAAQKREAGMQAFAEWFAGLSAAQRAALPSEDPDEAE
ncbi:hypothetical protein L0F51_00050 [Afifella sp. H1R]|uniref:hypothetical protein n=1 Tax=Afifella sp. H1R TaxID=2908841 RepID=UPI001F33AFEF|nr:hypothetical protein [Afifella sp. H1R]MCF1502157.1 hypothetical protein [Afifella sp. H1R]